METASNLYGPVSAYDVARCSETVKQKVHVYAHFLHSNMYMHTHVHACAYGHGPPSADRCKLDDSTLPVVPVNGGTVLSFWGYTPMLTACVLDQ